MTRPPTPLPALTLDQLPLRGQRMIPRCHVAIGSLTVTGIAPTNESAIVAGYHRASGIARPGILAWVGGAGSRHLHFEAGFDAAPAVDGGRVYAATRDGLLHAFDARTGEAQRGFPVRFSPDPMKAVAPPLIVYQRGREPVIVVGAQPQIGHLNAGRVSAFTAGGQPMWPWEAGGIAMDARVGGLAARNDAVYVAANGNLPQFGRVVALDALSGRQIWRQEFPADADHRERTLRQAPVVVGDRVAVACRDGRMYLLDANTGAVAAASPPLGGSPATAPVWIPVGGGLDGVLVTRLDTGDVVGWTPGSGGLDWTASAAVDGLAWLGDDDEDGEAGVVAPMAAPARAFIPWHGHRPDWGAERLEKAGRWYDAARLWKRHGRTQPAAAAFERAGDAWRSIQRRNAAHAFSHAARLYWEMADYAAGLRCADAAAVCAGLPRITIACLTHSFIQFASATLTVAVRNLGDAAAARDTVWLRLHGDVSAPIEGTVSVPIPAGGEQTIPLALTPTLERNALLVDVVVDSGLEEVGALRTTHRIDVSATPAPQPINFQGDLGVLNLTLGAGATINTGAVGFLKSLGEIEDLRIEGDAGMNKGMRPG